MYLENNSRHTLNKITKSFKFLRSIISFELQQNNLWVTMNKNFKILWLEKQFKKVIVDSQFQVIVLIIFN